MTKKKYVLIGASCRACYMFAKPMTEELQHCTEIVGIFDPNPLRMEAVKAIAGLSCASYIDFDTMIAETRPDRGIITTKDCHHHEYIIRCLEAGIDAITEKPMTIDAEKCKAVLDAEKKTGRNVVVTFNCRFAPYVVAVKKAVYDGSIGRVLNVDFEYFLDTRHGADYFRRWHRCKENSGGLLVHKSTHHFDMINWWIDEEPEEVMAFGARRFYGPTRSQRGERCLTCRYKNSCEFFYDITSDEVSKLLYLDCESADGYYRDRCVFADEIDIEDTMSVNVRYSNDVFLSYSLIAHSAYEGWKMTVNGTEGRLEAAEYYTGVRADEPVHYLDLYDRESQKITSAIPKAIGGHGGGDERLRKMVLEGGLPDPLGQQASSYAGAVSILIGIAANKSIVEGRNIRIRDLVPLDDYTGIELNDVLVNPVRTAAF